MDILDDLIGETMETAGRMLGGNLVCEKLISNGVEKVRIYDVVSGGKRFLVYLKSHVYSDGSEDVVGSSESEEIGMDEDVDDLFGTDD